MPDREECKRMKIKNIKSLFYLHFKCHQFLLFIHYVLRQRFVGPTYCSLQGNYESCTFKYDLMQDKLAPVIINGYWFETLTIDSCCRFFVSLIIDSCCRFFISQDNRTAIYCQYFVNKLNSILWIGRVELNRGWICPNVSRVIRISMHISLSWEAIKKGKRLEMKWEFSVSGHRPLVT